MAVADTAKLLASLELQDKFTATAQKIEGSLGRMEKKTSLLGHAISTGLGVGLERLAEKGISALTGAVEGGISSLESLQSATTSVDGAITQMGLTGKVTSGQVATWANEIEDAVGAAFDDKAITQATTTLIRFGKVTPSNLRPAMQVMTDLATKTGSVDTAASLLARALADPEKAAGKLARAGVVLTKAQQDQIKAMVKTGDVAGAQKLLLDDLTTATKGAAAASQGPGARSMAQLKDAVEDAERALAEGLLPVIDEVRTKITTWLKDPQNLQRIRDFGQTLASGFRAVVDFAGKIPWNTIGDALRIGGMGAKAVLDAFVSMPTWVQTAVITGWGLNKLSGGAVGGLIGELGKGLIKGVLGMNAGVVNINAGVVNGAGGVPGAVGAAGGGLSLLGAATGLTLAAGTIVALGEVIRENVNPNSSGDLIQQRAPNAYQAEYRGIFKAITDANAASGAGAKQDQMISDLETIDQSIRTGFRKDTAGALDKARQSIVREGDKNAAASAKIQAKQAATRDALENLRHQMLSKQSAANGLLSRIAAKKTQFNNYITIPIRVGTTSRVYRVSSTTLAGDSMTNSPTGGTPVNI